MKHTEVIRSQVGETRNQSQLSHALKSLTQIEAGGKAKGSSLWNSLLSVEKTHLKHLEIP